jgi:hypothetical protein
MHQQTWQRLDAELARVTVDKANPAALTTTSLTLLDALDKVVARLATQADAKGAAICSSSR